MTAAFGGRLDLPAPVVICTVRAQSPPPAKDPIVQMLYNSDSYVVVRFEMDGEPPAAEGAAATDAAAPRPERGGYEIVDKFARKEIFLQGSMAEHFKEGVEALIRRGPTEEEVDDYLEGFTALMQQPVVLH